MPEPEVVVETKDVSTEKADPTGLGLTDFISNTKTDTKSSSSSDKEIETKTDKVDEAKKEDTKDTKKADAVDTKKEDDNKSSVNWDADDNPYKKRYHDTAKWANSVNQELAGIKKDVSIANKKLDGTYDAEAEAKAEVPDPNQIAQTSEIRGKVAASAAMAEDKYGKEYVQKMIFAENAPFRQYDNDPYVQSRVLSSNAPVMEAIRIMKEREFFGKYGHEPEAIEAKIRDTFEKELTDKITKQVTADLMKRIDEKGKQVTGLNNARGSEAQKDTKTVVKPLSNIFQN